MHAISSVEASDSDAAMMCQLAFAWPLTLEHKVDLCCSFAGNKDKHDFALGAEGSGTVVACGENVTNVKVALPLPPNLSAHTHCMS